MDDEQRDPAPNTARSPGTAFIDRPDGRVAYEVSGTGPLVVLVPGMGDLRSSYRHVVPALVGAGYRVALSDLRGHGDSDTTFTRYGDVETAGDILALVGRLGGPAVVVGSSMAAGAAAYAAAERPELVDGLVLLGPFVRDAPLHPVLRALMRVALAPPWAALTWKAYLPSLYAGRTPADHDAYLRAVVAGIRRKGHARAFSQTARLTHAPVEARLREVSSPTLVLMGEQDPDFPDPRAEARWIADALDGTVVMVPEAGHYPQSQRPDLVVPAMLGFLARTCPRA